MPPIVARAIETVAVILGGLVIGYLARRRGLPDRHSPAIQQLTLSYAEPVVIILALWNLTTHGLRAFSLPFLAAALIAAMWPVGHLAGRLLRLRSSDLGAFILPAMFSNVGITYGTFLCYALLGERGVALGYLYVTSFLPLIYMLGFYVARLYGHGQRLSAWHAFTETLSRPESRNPLLAMAAGFTLYAIHLPRPRWAATVVDILVPATTFAKLFAIGLSMKPRVMLGYWRPAAAMHLLKFLISPLIGLLLAAAAGLTSSPDRALMQVMFIESAAPSAIMSLVLAQLTGLNVQLANACWLATNLSAVALAPLWLYIASTL